MLLGLKYLLGRRINGRSKPKLSPAGIAGKKLYIPKIRSSGLLRNKAETCCQTSVCNCPRLSGYQLEGERSHPRTPMVPDLQFLLCIGDVIVNKVLD